MGMSVKIKTILLEKGMTIKELSDKLGYKGNSFYNKLALDNWRENDLQDIANVLGCNYVGTFIDKDTGKQI